MRFGLISWILSPLNAELELRKKEDTMPRRERDRELARRRRRSKKNRKLRAKGLLPPVTVQVKGSEKKKPEKATLKEAPPTAGKEGAGPSGP